MSMLITPSILLTLTDRTGTIFKLSKDGIDQAQAAAQLLVSDLATGFSSDPAHAFALFDFAQGITVAPGSLGISGLSASAAFGGRRGGGSFGAGQGALNRRGFYADLFAWLEALRSDISLYGRGLGAIDLSTYAAYQNGLTAHSCLYSPDFAALYWYAYNQAQQLAPASVFAPIGVKCADFTITAANTGTLMSYETFANGYSVPAPTTDSYGNSVYQGNMPMAQGFAPWASAKCHVTTRINGTCAVTVHALNQAGAAAMWTATLDGAAANTDAALTPATSGDRIGGTPTAIAVAGTATAGMFGVQCASLERSY